MGKHRKYSDELKKTVIEEYLSETGMHVLMRKYKIPDHKTIREWCDKYLEHGGFPDGRGKSKGGGRPRKVDLSQMMSISLTLKWRTTS